MTKTVIIRDQGCKGVRLGKEITGRDKKLLCRDKTS